MPEQVLTEQHEAIAPRAVLTDRARQWAFEQVGHHDRSVALVADQLGVAWHTIMKQVTERGTPLIDDPTRLDGVHGVGVDETSFLRATGTRPTLYATGVADLTPGRAARLLDVVPGRSGRHRPPVPTRRLLRRRADRLTPRQRGRITAASDASDPHGEAVTTTWLLAQQLMAAYAHPEGRRPRRRRDGHHSVAQLPGPRDQPPGAHPDCLAHRVLRPLRPTAGVERAHGKPQPQD